MQRSAANHTYKPDVDSANEVGFLLSTLPWVLALIALADSLYFAASRYY